MILWTMQPIEVWNMICEKGVYHCDPAKCSMPEFADQYEWLVRQMEKRVGPPPPGVSYPVWAWYLQDGRNSRPDLRKERWCYGPGNEEYVCIEFEIPDNQVLLSDFKVWHIVLCNSLISWSGDEDERMESYYDTLSPEDQKAYREKNWERVFEVSPLDNDWIKRGDWVQATVWELKAEMIRNVRFFITGKYKHESYISKKETSQF